MKKINDGHRKRLRERFLSVGLDGFADYEIVELLLTLGTPRRDCKQQAKQATNYFKNLIGVLNASDEELQTIRGIGPVNIFGIKLLRNLFERYSRESIVGSNLLNTPYLAKDYLREKIGKENKEHFVVMYLDSRDRVVTDDVSIGILNASIIHPREVFQKAILKNASQVIFGHNHPSGDEKPSEDDIAITKRLIEAGKIIGIKVLDHIIVTKNNCSSLKEFGVVFQ